MPMYPVTPSIRFNGMTVGLFMSTRLNSSDQRCSSDRESKCSPRIDSWGSYLVGSDCEPVPSLKLSIDCLSVLSEGLESPEQW